MPGCAALLLSAGCAPPAAPAIEAASRGQLRAASDGYAELGGPDVETLRTMARVLLEHYALSRDHALSRDGFAQLRAAGARAGGALEWIVFEGRTTIVKARALSQLAALGDVAAGETLRVLSRGADGELLLLGIPHLRGDDDGARLQSLTRHGKPAVRAAAVARLAQAADAVDAFGGDLVLRLRDMARRDPAPTVRAAALSALASPAASGAGSAELVDVFVGRLDDSEQSVQIAAARGLLSLDAERAKGRVLALLGGDVSAHAIEAARSVQSAHAPDEAQLSAARGLLHRALLSKESKLRTQAAVAFASMPAALRPTDRLLQSLGADKDRGVRLQLALSIGAAHADAAAVLRALMATESIDAVTAAAALSSAGDDTGLARLRALAESKSEAIRAAVARHLLTSPARAHADRGLLFDDARRVHLAAAGALLALDA